MPISYVLDESYIRVDFFPKRGGMLRIAVPECVTIEAEELAGPDEIWVKFHLHPGGHLLPSGVMGNPARYAIVRIRR